MSLLIRRLRQCNNVLFFTKEVLVRHIPVVLLSSRNTFVPTLYDKCEDPSATFFDSNVQALLKRLTRPDFEKVFRKRTARTNDIHKWDRLKTPKYKFLTTEQLEEEIANARQKAEKLLQMPPVLKIQEPLDKVLSCDPALIGFDTSKYMFTDISFGTTNENRLVVERDIDGTLKHVDPDTKKRLNQIYFPIEGRKLKPPAMFTDDEKLYSLLDREEYEFVLNRAYIQYDPYEQAYQEITSVLYQHVDANKKYDLLRSTRHFGPLVFYLVWHRSADGLLLELLQTGHVREAVCLVALRHRFHGDVEQGDEVVRVAEEIVPTPIELPTHESMTEDDIQLDARCLAHAARYVERHSAMKHLHELALQASRESHQQRAALSRGVRKAHGTA